MTQQRNRNWFVRRWRAEVPVRQLLWWDMLGVGTLVNLSASLLALALVSQGVSPVLGAALHFAPLPYNLFLFRALYRSPGRTGPAMLVGFLWLLVMTVL